MCGIAGFLNFKGDFLYNKNTYNNILKNMCDKLYHRGPDKQDYLLSKYYGLAHTRLSIIDLENGNQPMTIKFDDNTYRIVYNGEIYNTKELKKDLITRGWTFRTTSDTEIILVGFIEYGIEIANMLNGIFAFFVVNENDRLAYLVRDQVGIKPVYYSMFEDTLVFSSEIKGLFEFKSEEFSSELGKFWGIKPKISNTGLNEILSIGPAKTYGSGVFDNISELKPGHYLEISYDLVSSHCYWKLKAAEHTDSYSNTVENVRFLVKDSIERQMISDVPIATFLSGGIDSSIVSVICANKLKNDGRQLGTFSFDFALNDKYFTSNSFQPTRDRPFVDIMVDYIKSNHRYLECNNHDLYENLFTSVDARDLPNMADVDSSMLYFCSLVSPFYKVVLTGECADEIFGGYPWFYREDLLNSNTFPWSTDISARKTLLNDEIITALDMDSYIEEKYKSTLLETPKLFSENKEESRRREISYLNIKWFMQTLIDRMDRASMYSGLEARVPFADIRILQYLYNVPWKMKYKDGIEKNLLREAMKDFLPTEIFTRKKSPYPKTYDPNYEKKLANEVIKIINNIDEPVNRLISKNKVISFINEKKDYGKPWYGQLMAGPQMLAYLLQINYWMKKYNV